MKKILRDLQGTGSLPIDLHVDKVYRAKPQFKHVLDLSRLDEEKIVITAGEDHAVRDLVPQHIFNHSTAANPEKVFFMEVEKDHHRAPNMLGELMRVAGAGIFILLILNGINSYQHGVAVKDNVITSAFSGYQDLVKAGDLAKKTQFKNAGGSFDQATNNFQSALSSIEFLTTNQQLFFAKTKTVQSVQALLESAKNLAEAGKDFSRGIEHLQHLPQFILAQNSPQNTAQTTSTHLSTDEAGSTVNVNENGTVPLATSPVLLTDQLKADLKFLDEATAKVEIANDNLALVDIDILPVNFQQKFKDLQPKLQNFLDFLHATQTKIPVLLKLLGDRYPHRYLILLQNDTEARPTGGFIGSYLIVDFNDGYLTKMDFHDVYESDGQLKEDIPAPEDIAKITKTWRLRDSNYSPDFALSAEKAAWFLQKEKGPSVDSVIAINQHFLADLLSVTGPIKLDGLKIPLTKDNYQTILSYIIESKLSGDQDPKKILREFIPAFKQQLFQSAKFAQTLKVAINGLQQKSILLYSRDPDIQNIFEDMGISGSVQKAAANEDYFNVITTSIGGNKSDLFMSQKLFHNTLIDENGRLSDEVTITREHHWSDEAAAKIQKTVKSFGFSDVPPHIEQILGAGVNKAVIKVYAPPGSTLMNAVGIDPSAVLVRQDNDLQKTYFMFEMDIKAGEAQTVSIAYQLPNQLDLHTADHYRIFIERQAGLTVSHLIKKIILKPGMQIYATFPENLPKAENGQLTLEQDLVKNTSLAVLVGK